MLNFRRSRPRPRPVSRAGRALLLTALAALGPSDATAQAAHPYEEGIVALVAEWLAPLPLVVLIDSAGSVLLPVEHITYHLDLRTSWSGSTLAVPHVSGGSARLDTTANSLTIGSTTTQLAPAEIVSHGPLVYLRSARLAELLGAEIQIDFATLTIAITRETPFPAQQRIIAEQRRAILLARQRHLEQRAGYDAAPYPSLTGGAIADWHLATSGLDPTELITLRTQLGAALFGGDIAFGAVFEAGSEADDHLRDATLRYHRVFPRSRHVRQVSAGDVLTSGLFARFVRGVELTNRPYLRSPELGAILVHPDLPAGWEYEVFQGNQLLGYSDIASFDPVAIPLRAGTTPVQVRMYGPSGEEVVSTLLYQTPVSLLPRDAIEYTVGAGECSASCEEFAHLDVRYGAASLFTAGAGFETFRDSAGSQFRPYFVYSMSTGLRATAEMTFMPFHMYSANVALFPRDGSRANVRGSISRPGLGPISLTTQNRMRWDLEALWDERMQPRDARLSQLRFGASASGLPGRLERWRISSTGSFTRGFLEARYDHDNTLARAHLLSGRAALYVPITVRDRPFRPLFNAALGVGEHGLRLAEAGFSVQPRSNAVITAGAQWSRGSSRPALSIGFNARTGNVQTAVRAVTSPSGVASSSLMLSGSTALATDGSLTTQPMARTGYAGLQGTVFIDRDDNGILSEGDEPVPDAHLVVGSFRTATDQHGKFRIWGMQPYEPVPVAIDSARTPDPSLTTSRTHTVVRLAPNMARRLDIPLVRTSELIGTLTASPAVPTIAGVTIDITDMESGAVTTTTTFSDGFYYVSRVRPGRYRLTVAPASLEALDAVAEPAATEFTVSSAGDELVVEIPPIHLRRR